MLKNFLWKRDPQNPILPPDPDSSYDSQRCMNPFVVKTEREYRLFYSGSDAKGFQRICLATALIDGSPLKFVRKGVILDVGEPGKFNAKWCVLPSVYCIGGKWHLYFSGHEGTNFGLQSFSGIGLATSDDGLNFKQYSLDAIITGDQTNEFPTNKGIAGGGTILEDVVSDGSIRYRKYYTLAVGTTNKDVIIDQEKHCAICFSTDGIHWTDHQVIMSPRRDVPNEDIAVAAPFVWRDGDLYRMFYSGIGTRWGFYSISEAYSHDGFEWHRGEGDENLVLRPDPDSPWENQMVEYPCVVPEKNQLRLFYCGNGYGATGIGMAVGIEKK